MPGFNSLVLAAGEAHGPQLIFVELTPFVWTILPFLLLLVAPQFAASPALI